MKEKAMEQTGKMRVTTTVGTVLILAIVAFYAYYIYTGRAHLLLETIRGYGFWGVVLGVALLTLLNVVPVPAEFVSIFLMELYGTWWGVVYSLIAGVLGAILAMYVTRWVARPLVESVASKHLNRVDAFIHNRGTIGLLAVRFIPLVPYHLVNYICGILRVRLLPFTWTTFLGILPYTLGMAGMYAGIRHGSLIMGVIGVVIFLILMGVGWVFRKKEASRKTEII